MDHHAAYMDHMMSDYGATYAAIVGRYQEGFLRDRVCRDCEAGFIRAVETAERLIHVIRIKAAA